MTSSSWTHTEAIIPGASSTDFPSCSNELQEAIAGAALEFLSACKASGFRQAQVGIQLGKAARTDALTAVEASSRAHVAPAAAADTGTPTGSLPGKEAPESSLPD